MLRKNIYLFMFKLNYMNASFEALTRQLESPANLRSFT